MATPLKQSITFSSKELYLEAMAIINVHVVYLELSPVVMDQMF